MKIDKISRYILSGVMFLSAFYPWNSFLTDTVSGNPVSLNLIFFTLLTAFAFFILFEKSRYVIPLVAAGYFVSFIFIVVNYYSISVPEIISSSVSVLFFPDKTLFGILNYFLLIIFSSVLWFAAFRLNYIIPEGRIIRLRFDIGLSAFLLLLLIKLVISVKGGDISVYNKSTDSFILYLISGLFLSGIHNSSKKHVVMKTGLVIVFFTMLVILTSVSIYYFFSPELKIIASSGFSRIGSVSAFLERGLVTFIKFFLDFRYRNKLMDEAFSVSPPGALSSPGGGVSEEIFHVFLGFIVLMIAVSLSAMLYFFLRMIFRALLSNRNKKSNKKPVIKIISVFLLLKKLYSILMKKTLTPAAVRYYNYLKLWGHFFGIRSVLAETPGEFASRLSSRFPTFRDEIIFIVLMHNDFIYGGISPGKDTIKKGSFCMKKIINPMAHLSHNKHKNIKT